VGASRDAGNHRQASGRYGRGCHEPLRRPADTRDFYAPALGAPVTMGAVPSHLPTCAPREGTTAAVG